MHHAEWEAAISILLGGQVRLSENQLIDSGAITILSRALRARTEVFRNRTPHRRALHPFVLGVRASALGHRSLKHAVVSTFREFNPKLETPRPFELSYWADITDKKPLRKAFASAVERGPQHLLRFVSAILPDFEPKAEALNDLLTYDARARSSTRYFDPEDPLVTMDRRISWLLALNDRDIERMISAEPALGPESEPQVRDLRDLLLDLQPNALGNRTAWYERLSSLPDAQREAAISFIDMAYNLTIGDSLRARTPVFGTTGENVRGNPLERRAAVLAQRSNDALLDEVIRATPAADQVNDDDLALVVSADPAELAKHVKRPVEWDKVWALVEDPRWSQSVDRLRRAMTGMYDYPVEEALDTHAGLIAAYLTSQDFEVSYDQRVLRIVRSVLAGAVVSVGTVYFGQGIGSHIPDALSDLQDFLQTPVGPAAAGAAGGAAGHAVGGALEAIPRGLHAFSRYSESAAVAGAILDSIQVTVT